GWPRSGRLALFVAGLVRRSDAEVLGRTLKAEHAAVLLILALLLFQVFLGKRGLVPTGAGAFAAAWLLWNAGATALSPISIPAAPNHLLKLALMVGAYLAVVNLIRREETLVWAFRAWLVVGTLEAAWGIAVWAVYVLTRVNLGIQMTPNLPVPVPYGTLLEGNIYGSHAMSLAAAYATLVLTRPGARLFGPRLRGTDVGLAVTLVATALGMSRGAWLGLAAALVTALLITRRLAHRFSRRAVLTAATLAVLLAFLWAFLEVAPKDIPLVDRLASFTRLEEEVTVVGRLAKYQAAFTSWLERPLVGWGTGSMAILYAERGRRWAWVSNLVLHLLLDTGVIGLALFGGFVATLLWRAARAARAAGPTFRRRVILALIAGFVGLLVAYQSTEATWLVLPWVHAGLLAAAARCGPHPPPAPSLSETEREGAAATGRQGEGEVRASPPPPSTPEAEREGGGAPHPTHRPQSRNPMAPPDVSVIVVNWNTRDLLRECLASAVAQADDVALELLVVDNASTDGSAQMVRQEFPQARLWENAENRGFAAANNQAIAQAQGRYLFLLNSDASLRPGALRALVEFLDAHPEAAVAGPSVLNPDGTVQPSCFRFPTAWDVFCEMAFLSSLFPRSPLFNRRGMGGVDRRTVREVDWVLGAAMAVRREWAERVGGLDEGYFIYAEELDWCRRIREAGGRAFFFPGAEVVHHGGVSKARAKAAILPRAFASRFRYYERFHGKGYARLVRALTLGGILPRMAVAGLLGYPGQAEGWREACRAYWGVLRVAWQGRWEPPRAP
ncbi:MAG: glycosyltransferase, partial [Anaerolineae bacterium]